MRPVETILRMGEENVGDSEYIVRTFEISQGTPSPAIIC
jgi:hypothetical protein